MVGDCDVDARFYAGGSMGLEEAGERISSEERLPAGDAAQDPEMAKEASGHKRGGWYRGRVRTGMAKWHRIRRDRSREQFAVIAGNIFKVPGWSPDLKYDGPDLWPTKAEFAYVHAAIRAELATRAEISRRAQPVPHAVVVVVDADELYMGADEAQKTLVEEYDAFMANKERAYKAPGFNLEYYRRRTLEWLLGHVADYPLLTSYMFDVVLHNVGSCSTERFFS
jgi:hypothetical protein